MQVHQVLTDKTNLVQDSPDIFFKFICRGFLKIIFLLKLSIFFFSGLSLLSFALHEKELFWEFKRIGSLSLQISNIILFEDCLSICAKEKYYNLRHLYGCIFTLPKTNMILSKLSPKFCLIYLNLPKTLYKIFRIEFQSWMLPCPKHRCFYWEKNDLYDFLHYLCPVNRT